MPTQSNVFNARVSDSVCVSDRLVAAVAKDAYEASSLTRIPVCVSLSDSVFLSVLAAVAENANTKHRL